MNSRSDFLLRDSMNDCKNATEVAVIITATDSFIKSVRSVLPSRDRKGKKLICLLILCQKNCKRDDDDLCTQNYKTTTGGGTSAEYLYIERYACS